MEKKQSSVEWLIEILNGKPYDGKGFTFCGFIGSGLIEKAKAMHKEEYIDGWMNGQNDSGYSQKELRQMAEEDYNETFKQ